MPMPHRVQMQLIKRRLVGKEGVDRVRELRTILAELPNYKNGPYADIRKWVMGEIEQTKTRSRVVHRDRVAPRREGAAQIAIVGPPNAGKSSLLQALSNIQIKTGDYPFTTIRPVACLTRIHDVLVQFVEIPGLIEGANDGKGGGRALLGVLRDADAIVYCTDVREPVSALVQVRTEVATAGIDLPAILAVTKLDEISAEEARGVSVALERVCAVVPDLPVMGISVLDESSLDAFREAAWRLTGLIRIFTRRPGSSDEDPLALPFGSTVLDAAATLHAELAEACLGARVWGASIAFAGQRVGRDHALAEGDVVEILT